MYDWRRIRRTFSGACLIAGPALFGVAALSFGPDDTGSELLSYLRGHTPNEVVSGLAAVAAIVMLVPACIGAMHVLRNRAPLLGYVGGGVALLGFAFLTVLVTVDGVAVEMAAVGTSSRDMATVLDRSLNQDALIGVMFAVFVAGHVLGTTLLGIGLFRPRIVPIWAAAAVTVSGPLHFVAHSPIGNRPLDLMAFTLFAVGLATLGVRILRMADDDWDTEPVNIPVTAPVGLAQET
jgi:hypothetical protein